MESTYVARSRVEAPFDNEKKFVIQEWLCEELSLAGHHYLFRFAEIGKCSENKDRNIAPR